VLTLVVFAVIYKPLRRFIMAEDIGQA